MSTSNRLGRRQHLAAQVLADDAVRPAGRGRELAVGQLAAAPPAGVPTAQLAQHAAQVGQRLHVGEPAFVTVDGRSLASAATDGVRGAPSYGRSPARGAAGQTAVQGGAVERETVGRTERGAAARAGRPRPARPARWW